MKKQIVKETSQEIRKITLEATKAIRDRMFAVNPKTGLTYYESFIDAYMKDALEDPSGRCGQTLASGLFNPDTMKMLDQEVDNAMAKQQEFATFRIRQTLYHEQQQVFDDTTSRKIMVITSRRAGKTSLNARLLIRNSLAPKSPALYLNKTFANAITQMYDIVMELLPASGLTVKKASKNEGLIEFTNGSSIRFGGVNDVSAIDKYRGFKFRLVIIDEIGHIKNGKYLIDEVLTPATSDYTDSQMVFTGTPPRVKNYSVELWESNIRKYHWTAETNPFIPDFHEFIERVCSEKGLTVDDPFIQREYYGNMTAWDTEAMVFSGYRQYDDSALNYDDPDFHPTKAYVGLDWGFRDSFAVVSFLMDPVRKKAKVYDCFSMSNVGADQKKAVIRKKYLDALERLGKYGSDKVKIVCDTNEPDVAYDLYNEGLPVEKAYKVDMMNDVESLAAHLRTGRIMVPGKWTEDTSDLVKDFNRTVYRRNPETDELMNEIDDDTYHPNAAHALRYAARNAFEGKSGGSAGQLLPVTAAEEALEKSRQPRRRTPASATIVSVGPSFEY